MSRDVEKDVLASSETEQLLSTYTCDNTSETCLRLQQCSTNTSYLQGDVSSLKSTPQDKSVLNHDVQIGEASNNSIPVISSSSITVNGNGDNDDPPPYTTIPPPDSVITLSNYTGWPYELFSFGNTYSMDGATCRVQIPLTPFQASLMPVTDFHSQETNGQHTLLPMSVTSDRFFKLNCHRNNFVSMSENDIGKINNKKSQRCSVIFVAAMLILFLMVLSLTVRFIMEKSLWQR